MVMSPIPELTAIEMLNSSDGWAIGNTSSGHSAILRWDGTDWIVVTHPLSGSMKKPVELTALSPTEVWIVAQDDVFSGGSPVVLRWDGQRWSMMGDTLPVIEKVSDILAFAPNDIWIFGGKVLPAPSFCHSYLNLFYPTAIHWDGHQWREYAPATNRTLYCGHSIWAAGGVEPDDIWTSLLFHWDGSTWHENANIEDPRYSDFDFVAANDGWLVAGRDWTTGIGTPNLIKHWDGKAWLELGNPSGAALMAIDMVSATEGWTGGEFGALLPYSGEPVIHQYSYLPAIRTP